MSVPAELRLPTPPAGPVGNATLTDTMAGVRVTCLAAGLSVSFDGHAYVRNLTLPRWQPAAGWRFGFGARTSAAVDEHLLGSISISADALVEDLPLSLEVTLNGQQFSPGSVEYAYRTAPHVSALCPTSGPVSGNTSVLVHGARFSSRHAWLCRFGNSSVSASFRSDAQLGCVSPARATVGELVVEVSVDSRNFTASRVPYSYYADPAVSAIAPTGGPGLRGATVLSVSGVGFSGGSDYRCRFGEHAVRAVRTGGGNLTCTSPQRAVAEAVSVEVTLNGQQYSRGGAPFAYRALEVVSSLSPSSGPSAGSTVVRVSGSHFHDSAETLCRFGGQSTRATWVSSEELRCASGSAGSAGASVASQFGFSGGLLELAGRAVLHGAACLVV